MFWVSGNELLLTDMGGTQASVLRRGRVKGLYGYLRPGRGRAAAGPGRPVPPLRSCAGPAAIEDDVLAGPMLLANDIRRT